MEFNQILQQITIPAMEYDHNSTEECTIANEAMMDEIAMEGYNWNQKAKYTKNIQKAKLAVHQAAKLKKEGNIDGAKKCLDQGIVAAEKAYNDFRQAQKENQNALNAVCGFFAFAFRSFGQSLLLAFGATAATTAIGSVKGNKNFEEAAEVNPYINLNSQFQREIFKADAVAKANEVPAKAIKLTFKLKKIITGMTMITRAIKDSKDGKGLSASNFNAYTNELENNMKVMIEYMKLQRKALDKK